MQADNNKKTAAEEKRKKDKERKEKARKKREENEGHEGGELLPRSRRWKMVMVGEVVVRVGEVRKRG